MTRKHDRAVVDLRDISTGTGGFALTHSLFTKLWILCLSYINDACGSRERVVLPEITRL